MDDVVGGKFKIGRIIGSGTYGELHEGVDIESGEEVAIKLEPVNTEYPLLYHESEMYKRLDGGPGIPKLKWFGVEGEHNILVIDLLGPSLADLLWSRGGRLDMKTVLLLAVQLIVTLEYIHSRGVVHRDIKPENLLMGLGSNAHKVYLVDFGLAGYYKDPSSDEHIEYRLDQSFVGTYWYASVFTHYGIVQSRRDDLDSLGYVLLYLLNGSLPWQEVSAERDQKELNEFLYQKKSETSFEELCKSYPQAFKSYFSICRRLSFQEKPLYRYLRSKFLNAFEDLGYQSDYIYHLPTPLKNKTKKKGADNEETNAEK